MGDIREFVEARGIKGLLHFTRAENLESILTRGLVPRDALVLEGFDNFNDSHRIDGTNAVCLSIGFPNYKMFYGLKLADPAAKWAIVGVSARVLWELDCAFCAANAASAAVTAIPIAQRKGLNALKNMYADWVSVKRSDLKIPDHYPTNPQAEVLALQGVPRRYILGVIVLNELHRQELLAKFPDVEVRVSAQLFRYRKDYEYWR